MARAERFVKVLPLGEWKNTSGIRDAIAFENNAAVMDGVIREENRFEHFRRGFAIDPDAGLDGFAQLDGLFDGDEGADANVGETFDRLDDDLDIFALLAGGGEDGEIT